MANTARFMSATTLIGDGIRNPQNESLGDLKEIMMDTASGKIAYGVVSYGGILGLGDKLFAVPWSAFSIDHENHKLVLNVSKERLKDAPGFDKDNWPNFADPAFTTSIGNWYQ
ncbi:MAG: PRC-barrel domain-containing protein [Dokdonella sp.]|nr:PRC-barrel domain-containing protein [Dokdonella sp.]MCB1570418.1 PRC-barrel domain-containing protein [Xanthomonadales bacterium]MCB1573020.1 PRC-barrel domain-containing protein [Xanthomonadales bacterium]MCB1576141.1 PRC-barrel domain-containing protein [Xanthomonadales bacterium]